MTTYDDAQSMGEARQRYFADNGFDGSYDERWVKLKAGPIPLAFPNAAGRVRAVKLHDLHHIATGYQTTWTGEAEISAWEIAGGCAHFGWAWYLNLSGLAIGVAIAPAAVFRAFVRGRHSRNLYHTEGEFREPILRRSVGEVRRSLGLAGPPVTAKTADRISFALWTMASVLLAVAPWALLAFLIGRFL